MSKNHKIGTYTSAKHLTPLSGVAFRIAINLPPDPPKPKPAKDALRLRGRQGHYPTRFTDVQIAHLKWLMEKGGFSYKQIAATFSHYGMTENYAYRLDQCQSRCAVFPRQHPNPDEIFPPKENITNA